MAAKKSIKKESHKLPPPYPILGRIGDEFKSDFRKILKEMFTKKLEG